MSGAVLPLDKVFPPLVRKCGDRRDVPRFLNASEPTEKLVNVPSVPTFPKICVPLTLTQYEPNILLNIRHLLAHHYFVPIK